MGKELEIEAGRVPSAPGATSLRSPEPVPVSAQSGDAPSRGPWALDYIEDAATKRVTIRSPRGTVWTDNSNYDPPENGIHLCGQTDDGEQPTTVASYPMSGQVAAWLMAREVAECSKDEHDFVVDLMIDGSLEDDFYSNRQLWPRAIEAWNASYWKHRDRDRSADADRREAAGPEGQEPGPKASPNPNPNIHSQDQK